MSVAAKVTTGSEKPDRGGRLRQVQDAKGIGVHTTPVVNGSPVGASALALGSNPAPSTPLTVGMRMAGGVTKNQRNSGYVREKEDWYCEPDWTVQLLFDNINFDDQAIYDPSCGRGNIPAVATEYGFDTLASDIIDRGFPGVIVSDFLTADFSTMDFPPRLSVVMNPPYKHTEDFVRRALEIADHRVAIIVPLSWLASSKRHELFCEFPPSDVLVLSRRPSMPPGRKIEELGDKAFKSGMVDFCWIVWTRPHDRETRVRWVL